MAKKKTADISDLFETMPVEQDLNNSSIPDSTVTENEVDEDLSTGGSQNHMKLEVDQSSPDDGVDSITIKSENVESGDDDSMDDECTDPPIKEEIDEAVDSRASDESLVSSDKVEGRLLGDSWYIPVHRGHLINVLSSGIIAPAGFCQDRISGVQGMLNEHLFVVKNGVSDEFINDTALGGNKGFTVLIEVDDSLIFSSNDSAGSCRFVFYSGVLPITLVKAIHFLNERDYKNFVSRPYENVMYDSVPLTVNEDVFKQSLSLVDINESIQNVKTHNKELLGQISHKVDSYIGAVNLFMLNVPSKEEWFQLSLALITGKETISKDNLVSVVLPSDLEISLFNNAFELMLNTDACKGWQPKNILNELYLSIDKDSYSKESIHQFEEWHRYCEAVLENQKQVRGLSDENMIAGRAILLLLLREGSEDLKSSVHSSLAPGKQVLALANLLAGARIGYLGLPSETKMAFANSIYLSNLKSDMFNSRWNASDCKQELFEGDPELLIEKDRDETDIYKLNWYGKPVIQGRYEGCPELKLVKYKAEILGKHLKYESEIESLSYVWLLDNGRTQKVYVSVGNVSQHGYKSIRFWSPCFDFEKVKMTKEEKNKLLYNTLVENGKDFMSCRFALNDKGNLMQVIVDQLLDTLDGDELKHGLEHVATIADRFEERYGLDRY